jgi:hypothetical protein
MDISENTPQVINYYFSAGMAIEKERDLLIIRTYLC